MPKQESGKPLSVEEYENRVDQIKRAVTEVLNRYQLNFQVGGDLTFAETGPTPVAGIILVDSYGKGEAAEKSDVDFQVLVDGEIAGKTFVTGLANDFGLEIKEKVASTLEVDTVFGDIDFTDKTEVRAALQREKKVLIIYNQASAVWERIGPIITQLGVEARWLDFQVTGSV